MEKIWDIENIWGKKKEKESDVHPLITLINIPLQPGQESPERYFIQGSHV